MFIRGRKLNISLVFITQSCFKDSKDVRLNTSNFFIAKISNKTELRDIAINHSSDIFEVKNTQNEFLNKLSNIKIGKKMLNKEK